MNLKSLLLAVLSATLLNGCTSSSSDVPLSGKPPSSNAPLAIKVATWNAEHLAFPTTEGCKPRILAEIEAMKHYVQSVDADIYALQEVASSQALAFLFPEKNWQLIMSGRPDSPQYECRESGFLSTQQKVAFAVKKGITIKSVNYLDALSLNIPGLRYGLNVSIETSRGDLDLLNIHMKSGCFVDDFTKSDSPACEIYSRQAPVLKSWISARSQANKPFVILGDFNHRISAPYNRLTRSLFYDTDKTAIVTRDVIGCHPRYPAPIDHIVTGGFNADKTRKSVVVHHFKDMRESAMLSDHCAISAVLQ